jgi:hypothetical protein
MVRALAKAGVVWSFTVVPATSTLAAQATTVTLQGTITGSDGPARLGQCQVREESRALGLREDRAKLFAVRGP